MIQAIDLFCGAGGTSTGLRQACDRQERALKLLAVNHWDIAIETHSANHPESEHLCESLDGVDPRKLVKGKVDLLIASPECTHHSIARGGKPMSDQSRASAWHVTRWAEALLPTSILVENVREFQDWGPIGSNGRPLKRRKGQTFMAWIETLRSLGYAVEWRILNAANYGDATTRERLFVQARRGRRKISWPAATHTPTGSEGLFQTNKRWRPARDIIDWSMPGQSIFTRKKPLAPATLERIAAGLKKFGGAKAEPFLVMLRQHMTARSVNAPLPTLTAGGNHVALCEPFVLGQQSCAAPRSVESPIPTVATQGAISLIEAFIVPQFSQGATRSVERPIGALTTTSRGVGLCEPFMVQLRAGQDAKSLGVPVSKITTMGAHHAIAEPVVIPLNHGSKDRRSHCIEKPMPTITTIDAWGMFQPCLIQYNGTADARPVDEPVPTVTAKDRFGLLEPGYQLDIRFRMLQPHELAAAMGFPADYKFSGTREQRVKQIGNAVCVNLADALCSEILFPQ